MALHRFKPERFYTALGPYDPVLRIADGDSVATTTADASGRDLHNDTVAAAPNPQTGPFYVEGAEPGDVLQMHLDKLWPNRTTGFSGTTIAPNTLDPEYVVGAELLRHEVMAEWQFDLQAGTASLAEPCTGLGRLAIPLQPMLGCFGVAPADNQAISTATSSQHGGNMDYKRLVAGTTVYFPVFAPGALVFVGDGHAVQGDGELVGTGIETSFAVQFTVTVIKGKRIHWPRAENATHIMTIGCARPLDQALQHATTEMIHWLEQDYGLEPRAVHILLGQCVEYEVGNVFDPAYTMVCKVAKELLSRIQSICN